MAQQTVETFLQSERDRFKKTRDDLETKRKEITEQIEAVDRELYALEVYEQAKKGKFKPLPGEHTAAFVGEKRTRARKGEFPALQTKILAIVVRYLPEGARAEAINAELDATDDETKKKIAAALNRMKTQGVLKQEGRRQPYILGSKAPQTSDEAPASADDEAA